MKKESESEIKSKTPLSTKFPEECFTISELSLEFAKITESLSYDLDEKDSVDAELTERFDKLIKFIDRSRESVVTLKKAMGSFGEIEDE